jgi:glutamate formiminotransferase
VYISEGRDTRLLSLLRSACGPPLVHVFADAHYNRTGFTLASASPDAVCSAVSRLCDVALSSVDLRRHEASHPRLGVVDHVSVHALAAQGALPQPQAAIALSLAIADFLAARLPVHLYGAASPAGARLADVRRSLGYFGASPSPPRPPRRSIAPMARPPSFALWHACRAHRVSTGSRRKRLSSTAPSPIAA